MTGQLPVAVVPAVLVVQPPGFPKGAGVVGDELNCTAPVIWAALVVSVTVATQVVGWPTTTVDMLQARTVEVGSTGVIVVVSLLA